MTQSTHNQVVVVGSIAFDTIQTPEAKIDQALGGSATYFACACRFFSNIRMVGVVGKDFSNKYIRQLQKLGINTNGIAFMDGNTFHWKGSYAGDMAQALTKETHLNVFAEFRPLLSEAERQSRFLFLANIDPVLQLNVMNQIRKPQWIACDTMNYWIQNAKSDLLKVFKNVDICFINDAEIRDVSGEYNLLKAANWLRKQGPSIVIIKKGEHGVLCSSRDGNFSLPAYLIENVKDPTGAGDSFAGGFLGYLTKSKKITHTMLKKAAAYGTIVASYNVQSFSIKQLSQITLKDINKRYKSYQSMISLK